MRKLRSQSILSEEHLLEDCKTYKPSWHSRHRVPPSFDEAKNYTVVELEDDSNNSMNESDN
jgi:hypothetical protein